MIPMSYWFMNRYTLNRILDGQNGGGAYSDYQETLLEDWPSLINILFNISLEDEE